MEFSLGNQLLFDAFCEAKADYIESLCNVIKDHAMALPKSVRKYTVQNLRVAEQVSHGDGDVMIAWMGDDDVIT